MLDYFAALVAEDEGLPLTEAALSLAQDAYPDLDMQGTLAEIDALVDRLKKRLAKDAGLAQKLPLLNRFFFRELGFAGNQNDFYDPDNSHLNVVLRKRRGIPISLAVLYLEMAQQLQLPAGGVSFPGHFMLRVTLPAGEVMLDPMSGESLSEAQLMDRLDPYLSRRGEPIGGALRALLQPATAREILARMLRNLKSIYLQTERWQRLLAVQQRLAILLPQDIEERRDRGLAFARLDYLRPAIEDLQAYLGECPAAEDATVIESQLVDLRRRVQQASEGPR
ncbi:tetratricopeptide repeat protein [Robbsia sp. Bb-Pol-6]|uniref:Tetratricopeptide repeat protein n=1 Tax=Robbsia betulipollinis TaxID=2981849 RepID=A0ABT3ZSD3_9BURK|nr:tetratricopeptide repeat protein [Robbsia betulipollinis]MCY0388803.1 tetratricopeptide repeat protein [Robbsia betulipollinis]